MRLWTLTDRYRATFSPGRDPSAEAGLVNALKAKDRDSLIKAFEAERDQIWRVLCEAFGRDLEDFNEA